jgi:hypothetical protein
LSHSSSDKPFFIHFLSSLYYSLYSICIYFSTIRPVLYSNVLTCTHLFTHFLAFCEKQNNFFIGPTLLTAVFHPPLDALQDQAAFKNDESEIFWAKHRSSG